MADLTDDEREALRGHACQRDYEAATERIVAARERAARAEALREAADDPALRLSGHSGISIKRLRDLAERWRPGCSCDREETPDA